MSTSTHPPHRQPPPQPPEASETDRILLRPISDHYKNMTYKYKTKVAGLLLIKMQKKKKKVHKVGRSFEGGAH